MYILIAEGRLAAGATEAAVVAGSKRFHDQFITGQRVLRRTLVADDSGRYADIVVFEDEAAIGEVMAAEETSDVAAAYLALWDDVSVKQYRVLQSHD